MFSFAKKYKQIIFEDPVIIEPIKFVDASTNTDPEIKLVDYTVLFDDCVKTKTSVFKLYFLDFITKIQKESFIYIVICFFLKK
jgi:hypothetical protein